ncbi:hypothetical protein BDF20DRAFT_850781 [Mycotypha africana]|uniref:uncharacterized protein n=1 Tax=Mycotypha africana TaxID=64632 RepID=UPI002301C5CC|nr:uncharacterized protein BDF20DRAFT_850781 [Mycotypha africana]KAI8987536.1 hypothetical protein BDF20DRAFT_850781 [Mycotypha africana]
MILDLFAKSRQVACVVNVGCCYNALTEKGFPMSSYLQRQQKTESAFYLNSTSRVLSCHSPSRWIEEGQQCIAAFDNYFFRALFQVSSKTRWNAFRSIHTDVFLSKKEMLVNKGLSDINDPPRLGRIKQNKDFVTFVKAALRRMKLPPETITEEEAKSHLLEAKRKSQDKQFIILWTLRGMLAPILESIILMDRWLYLNETIQQNSRDHVHEENSQRGPWMYPLFDLSISPRNVVLVASK